MKIRKEKFGFTLVELLVVISIIAILLAILMPALAKVREQGKSTVCKSRMKEFGLALSLYAAENRGVYVTEDWVDNGKGTDDPDFLWFSRLGKYVGAIKDASKMGVFFRCPAGMAVKDFGDKPAFSFHATDYGLQMYHNGYSSTRTSAGMSIIYNAAQLSSIARPAQFAASFDFYFGEESLKGNSIADSQGNIQGGGVIYKDIWYTVAKDADFRAGTTGNGIYRPKVFRHGKSINVVYADTHVGSIKPHKLEWVADEHWWWAFMCTPSSVNWKYRPLTPAPWE